MQRPEHAVAVDLERAPVGLDQLAEGALVTRLGRRDQRAFVTDLERRQDHGA